MMNKLIIANWKMNPPTLKEAVRLARSYDKKGVVIAPPLVFIEEVGKVLKKASLGAQDLKISADKLKRLKIKYVIIGHSDRRALGETDAMIAKKLKIVLAYGLRAILCVGEKWNVRKRGIAAAKRFVASQLRKDLGKLKNSKIKNLFVAYEPVWAIGTGKNETPENASEMARIVKKSVAKSKIRVLYGGSVNAKNAKLFLETRNVDGLLVGGVSLKAEEFNKIIKNA